MSILYARSSGVNNAAIGKMETPIKMLIEHESDILTKKGGICDKLFNVEKSTKFGETIVGESEFGVFKAAAEGANAEGDTIKETYKKFIEHIQFMKEFVITAEMMEDAQYGVAADAKHRAENFTRAYYKTMNKICEYALINGTSTTGTFSGATLDLSTPDTKALFANNHGYGIGATVGTYAGTQSNFYYGDILSSTSAFETALGKLTAVMRSMKDENGEALGYAADTIILPGNRPAAENIVKKVCGSEGALGNGYNDVNLEYGRWNIVVLPNWQTNDDRIMIMSGEANKNLRGNMFFNRIPLTVSNFVDYHSGNYIWNGRCRFGVGFGTYKHIMLCVHATGQNTVAGATALS